VSRYVLDNTVTMAWCFAEESSEFTETLLRRLASLDDEAVVPALWMYEAVNVVELAVRKGRVSQEKGRAFFESLTDLPILVENLTQPQVFVSVWALASQHKLTAYDASYLELAIRRRLPIASSDTALVRAALAAGVPALGT
jgi:predicted nucleic acid-binding protein